ncbi:MAG TPA: hypothetical protein VFI51_13595 [Bradyrhizobium sp.]|nr:hypothetical protein [Bradyrhizobium sp.]
MALHRDIYWVGRQWTVTGFGLQAVDQKQKGKFDIESSRLWEDGVLQSLRAERWLNLDDFETALAVARKRFPEPPQKTVLPPEKAAPLEEMAPGLETYPSESPSQPLTAVAQGFDMRIESWPARFVRQWRIRIRR